MDCTGLGGILANGVSTSPNCGNSSGAGVTVPPLKMLEAGIRWLGVAGRGPSPYKGLVADGWPNGNSVGTPETDNT